MLDVIQKDNAICCLFPHKKKNERGKKRESKKDGKDQDEQDRSHFFVLFFKGKKNQ